jgi:hypothetical protein
VPGINLIKVLRDYNSPWWGKGGPEGVGELMENCGGALGVYHSSNNYANQEYPSRKKEAEKDVHLLSRRLARLGGPKIDPALVVPVACYQDFRPGNVIVTEDNILAIIDPPYLQESRTIHRDVANFIYQMRRDLVIYNKNMPSALKSKYLGNFTRRFLTGYALTGPRDLHDQPHLRIIWAYNTLHNLQFARKRWGHRSYAESAMYVRWFVRDLARLRLNRFD